jgi:uncharacterized membrane protein
VARERLCCSVTGRTRIAAIEDLGPIQLLAIAFGGNRFRGEILPELERLKRERIVRVIDLVIVRKDGEGNVMVTTGSDLDWEEASSLGSYLGAIAGFDAGGPAAVERGAIEGAAELADGHIFDDDDVFRITQALPANQTAAVALIEHRWAVPLFDAVARADGYELSNHWIRPEKIIRIEPGPPATPED